MNQPLSTARSLNRLCIFAFALLLTACSSSVEPVSTGVGANPKLPEPDSSLLPVVNIAPAVGWIDGAEPTAADGLDVNAFARGLDHPRWIYTLPNGDVLVAESNSPGSLDGIKGIKGWFARRVITKAGGAVPSANRITLLRDADGDGVAEFRSALLENLHSPFGIELVGNTLYVANADAVVSFPYVTGDTRITTAPTKVVDLPSGINHHWTKNILASADGLTLYASVGSNSNIGENGMDQEVNRAAILKINPRSGELKVFADGLRNPVGLAWNPQSKLLWTTVNERDELGNNLVPDYMTQVEEGQFFGWPYSYYGQNVDTRVKPQRPDLVAKAVAPSYALGSHVAALGLEFYTDDLLPSTYKNGAFIGLHGSWNRKPRSGYKVIFVPFVNGQPSGNPVDILSGFVDSEGRAQGRPVGVKTDKSGALLIADDVGNVIWRVTPAARTTN
ncbi:MAG: sorbosone dehydrogenase family protein [Gammaproteobacteria bacterium]